MEFTSREMRYVNFCQGVIRAGKETAVVIDQKWEGWYTASKSILAPAIQEKNQLHHRLHDRSGLSPDEITNIKAQLKVINKHNHDLVELTKVRWYEGICEKIHKMSMNPCLAWENIRILTGGESAHHKTNLNMSMRLASGEFASNAKENMSMFGLHFTNLLNNHRPVDYSVLDLLDQKPCMTSIDNPITFSEVKKAINKLKKGKLPGLNGIPLKALKAMYNSPRRIVHCHVCKFFEGEVDQKGGTKANVFPCQKKAT